MVSYRKQSKVIQNVFKDYILNLSLQGRELGRLIRRYILQIRLDLNFRTWGTFVEDL